MGRIKAGINTTRENWGYVFRPETVAQLHEHLEFDDSNLPDTPDKAFVIDSLRDARVVLSTWGAVPYDSDVLSVCPGLALVTYGAGSVKYFLTEELIAADVAVCSAVHLNAQPVAEFTLGLIFTALKNVFAHHHAFLESGRAAWTVNKRTYRGGYYRTKIGVLGFGQVSRRLLDLLRPFDFEVMLEDPSVSTEEARKHGARKVEIDEIMKTCDVVTLHHADIPRNENMINKEMLGLMKDGARFINTSRGRLVNEVDLAEELSTGRIWAFLDVTHPEPPAEDSTLYGLKNCVITPHVAGSIGTECFRMGDYCLREVENWIHGRAFENCIDLAAQVSRA